MALFFILSISIFLRKEAAHINKILVAIFANSFSQDIFFASHYQKIVDGIYVLRITLYV